MHELSVAQSLIDLLADQLAGERSTRVSAVRLAVGQLSGVLPQALRSAFHIAAQNTPFESAELMIEDVPPRVWCQTCASERAVQSVQSMRCVICAQPSHDVRAGRELNVISMEVFDEEPCDG